MLTCSRIKSSSKSSFTSARSIVLGIASCDDGPSRSGCAACSRAGTSSPPSRSPRAGAKERRPLLGGALNSRLATLVMLVWPSALDRQTAAPAGRRLNFALRYSGLRGTRQRDGVLVQRGEKPSSRRPQVRAATCCGSTPRLLALRRPRTPIRTSTVGARCADRSTLGAIHSSVCRCSRP